MITLQELNPQNWPLTKEQSDNLAMLLIAMNKVRQKYGKPMRITSGVRNMQDHIAIYAKKGITDLKKIPMSSKHLLGAACDVQDSKGELKKWILQNLDLIQSCGLYLEDFRWTKGWVHFQCHAPLSGKRIFLPFADTKTYPMNAPDAWDGKYDSKYD